MPFAGRCKDPVTLHKIRSTPVRQRIFCTSTVRHNPRIKVARRQNLATSSLICKRATSNPNVQNPRFRNKFVMTLNRRPQTRALNRDPKQDHFGAGFRASLVGLLLTVIAKRQDFVIPTKLLVGILMLLLHDFDQELRTDPLSGTYSRLSLANGEPVSLDLPTSYN